ncbi:rho guanine nucleotide exchange factor 28 isoform X2 [Dunckerocampus dactyliophorus]|uniref:rho guanine nucleotide exchange factor 28 isoform X2 n=1 Tax=Dunckerocampus dactyliophorus TaxID=161453 RepID=UPI0024060563|nr:rho guanine nucleotide exchange factor 28 isoform X2 [Dunckerocampus dactyliophorus]
MEGDRRNATGGIHNSGLPPDEGVSEELPVAEEKVLVDTSQVFEEQLDLALDDDDEEEEQPSSSCARMQSRSVQFSQHATVPPPPMNGCSGNLTQADDVDFGCSINGVTSDSTETDASIFHKEDLLVATDTPSPPPLSVHTMDTSILSPSHVSLEVDSEDDDGRGAETRTLPLLSENDGPAPDLVCTRSLSTSSACDPASKALGDSSIRLRSYSYSKVSFRPSRFVQDGLTCSTEQKASEQPHEKREFSFRHRAQSADDEGGTALVESLQHLTLSEFLKEIEEEEQDRCSDVPAKAESDKYKVIRTFSFLRRRMSNTRSKTKAKGKEQNTHRFSTGSCLGPVMCVVCDKPALGKDLLHCPTCTATVHKSCKDSIPPCLKKLQEKNVVAMVKSRTASLPQNFTVRESPPQCGMPPASSLPVVTSKDASSPVAGGSPSNGSRLSGSSESEVEERQPTSSLSNEWTSAEEYSDLATDVADYEAESWSLAVEHRFCKKQDRRVVKRQDVIYELMQTELHHLQTLRVMAQVFRRGMREEVQLDAEAVERIFPCLDQLLLLHHAFFTAMKERRQRSAQPQGHRNYLIQRIGDVLLQQFSGEDGEKMRHVYGEFCSRHNEAVAWFKELLQSNKRFQNFIKQQGGNSLVRRREIPECILLVTQRITKYPVLLERILQYTAGDTQEHVDLAASLAHVRAQIVVVDLRVSEYERRQRLQDVWSRTESRSTAKLKNGRTLRKQDMMGQTLKHQGALLWKTATGRLKDVLALLLTDSLVFLQEKDQKYTFATVDQKPPVITLQKLIVREVANEERGMFLISASAAGPEMYEVHAASKEERNTWMRLVREAVESCPEEEDEYTSESEEEKRVAEARFKKVQKLQESLMSQDQQICSSLEAKLQIYAALSALGGQEDASLNEPRLLVRPCPEELPQAVVLLAAAVQEAENLKATLESRSPSVRSWDSSRDSVFPVSHVTPAEPPSNHEASPADPQPAELLSPIYLQRANEDSKIARSVQSLTQLLYSLQAAVTIQDSCYELQRFLFREDSRPLPRDPRRQHALQEQEKQRHLEKRKEEAVSTQRLHDCLRQDRERWVRECHARESQLGEKESRVKERERQCHLEAERLRRERDELDEQLEEYQQNLERLREGQKSVEKEREHLENHRKLLQTWRHSQQRSLPNVIPHMVIPLDGQQDSTSSLSCGHAGNCSVFLNEAALADEGGGGLNNRHRKGSDANTHNCLNMLLARSNSRQPSVDKTTTHSPDLDSQPWRTGRGYLVGLDTPSDHSRKVEMWSSGPPSRPPHPQSDLSHLVSMETDSGGEDSPEESIVYL